MIIDKLRKKVRKDFKGMKIRDGKNYSSPPIWVAQWAQALYQTHEKYSAGVKFGYNFLDPQSISIELHTISLFHDHLNNFDRYVLDPTLLFKEIQDLDTNNEINISRVAESLQKLNKHNYKSYLEFVLAAKSDPYARIVKIADITHNLSDLKKGSMKDKYQLALYILENP